MAKKDVLDDILSQQDNYLSQTDKENYVLEPLLDMINEINDTGIRSFVRAMLLKNDPFWHIPSSFDEDEISVPDEATPTGNVLHTLRVCRIVKVMMESYDLGDTDNDIMMAAALLHDLTKAIQSEETFDYEYDPYHPYTVDAFYIEVNKYDQKYSADNESTTLYIDEASAKRIMRLIRCHRGPDSPIPETYPTDDMELMLHHADSIAHNLAYIIDGDEWKEDRWRIE